MFQRVRVHLSNQALITIGEILVVVAWAVFAGQKLLNFDLSMWPYGGEYPLSIRENFFWPNLLRCGTCAFWNGNMDGGYPALLDLQGAALHPLVAIPTLLFGVINGSKITLILCLALAGIAQWWLGRLMGFGRVARIWAALMMVVAGSLAGKMENGLVTLVLSTACASLVIPAGLNLVQRPNRRAVVLLGVILAMAIVSGQGYLQIGMALSIIPALVILYMGDPVNKQAALKGLLLAVVVSVLLTGAFLVPQLHQFGSMVKDTNPTFAYLQPIEYLPLNLVIRNMDFFRGTSLLNLPFPYLYINYISWVPILLAALALRLIPRERIRLLLFFLIAIALVYLNSSLILPKLLFGIVAKEFLIGIRHPSLIAGLAVPFILGLAAWGLDLALKAGPRLSLEWNETKRGNIRLSWILLFIPLVWGLLSTYEFSSDWLGLTPLPTEVRPIINQVAGTSMDWMYFPVGELYWPVLAMERNLKLSEAFHPWRLRDRERPPANLVVERSTPDVTPENGVTTINGMTLSANPQNQYAVLVDDSGTATPCDAASNGGLIALQCKVERSSTLVVYEHSWAGWTARVDGARTRLVPGEWLSVKLNPGVHQINLSYVPWDVPIGFIISLMGIGLAVGLWRKNS